jgi:hypothetical protein
MGLFDWLRGGRKQVKSASDNDPGGVSVGILFSISAIKSGSYGSVVQEDFFRTVDAVRLEGCRISVGDIMPHCQFFCVKVDCPNPKVGKHIRAAFAGNCNARGLATPERRFMSGQPLRSQPLCERGYIAQGRYVGGPWS